MLSLAAENPPRNRAIVDDLAELRATLSLFEAAKTIAAADARRAGTAPARAAFRAARDSAEDAAKILAAAISGLEDLARERRFSPEAAS